MPTRSRSTGVRVRGRVILEDDPGWAPKGDARRAGDQYRKDVPESAAEPQSLVKKVVGGPPVQWYKSHPQISDWLLITPLLLGGLLSLLFAYADPDLRQRPFDLFAVFLMLGAIVPLA